MKLALSLAPLLRFKVYRSRNASLQLEMTQHRCDFN